MQLLDCAIGLIPCCYSKSGGPNMISGDSTCSGSYSVIGSFTLDVCVQKCQVGVSLI